jgi:hypothetical protein
VGVRFGRFSAATARRALGGVSAAALVIATLAVGSISAAFAQSPTEPDADFGERLEPFEADGPMLAVVSLSRQRLWLFDRTGEIASTQVSSGRRGFDTPEGVFTILERKVEHRSNLYDDAEMPFMQRLTWSGVALHQGVVPNYRASHGCIRLPTGFAERLFRTTRAATRVVIVGHDALPRPISHPVLPQPGEPRPAPAAREGGVTATSFAGSEQPMKLGAAPEQPASLDAIAPPAAPKPTVVPDTASLQERRRVAERELAEATKRVEAARRDVRPKRIEQVRAERILRRALWMARRAVERTREAAEAVDDATTERQRAVAITAHIESLIELVDAQGREAEARELAAQTTAAAISITDNVAALEAKRQKLHNEVRALVRRLAPVTLFVSRVNGRLYLRQAAQPIMDVPVTIRDPGSPLGTHIFKAFAAEDPKAPYLWQGLTIETPGGGSPVALPKPAKKSKSKSASRETAAATAAPVDPLLTARRALDRIEIPHAVLARVMPILQPGSTLIISDLGQSIETGPGTDIVVQTQGEEQAKRNIAKFVAKQKAEQLALSGYVEPPRRRSDTSRRLRQRQQYWARW